MTTVKQKGHNSARFDHDKHVGETAFDREAMDLKKDVKFGPGGRTARAFTAASTTLKKGCR